MDRANKLERLVKAGISISMYTILPLLAFLAWVIGVPLFIYGGMMTSVNEAQGIFQTVFIFSAPMILFFGIIPIYIQIKHKTSINDLGLKGCWNRRSIILLCCNITIALVMFIKLIQEFSDLKSVIPIIIQLCAIGISEEILCRGVIYHEIDNAFHSKILSIFISSIIFAFLFHSGDSDFVNLVVRLPLGLAFAIMRCYTGNVYNSIVMHVWYNSLMFIL